MMPSNQIGLVSNNAFDPIETTVSFKENMQVYKYEDYEIQTILMEHENEMVAVINVKNDIIELMDFIIKVKQWNIQKCCKCIDNNILATNVSNCTVDIQIIPILY